MGDPPGIIISIQAEFGKQQDLGFRSLDSMTYWDVLVILLLSGSYIIQVRGLGFLKYLVSCIRNKVMYNLEF